MWMWKWACATRCYCGAHQRNICQNAIRFYFCACRECVCLYIVCWKVTWLSTICIITRRKWPKINLFGFIFHFYHFICFILSLWDDLAARAIAAHACECTWVCECFYVHRVPMLFSLSLSLSLSGWLYEHTYVLYCTNAAIAVRWTAGANKSVLFILFYVSFAVQRHECHCTEWKRMKESKWETERFEPFW